jgi:polar amino acid transport system substrate-binding protein
MYARRCSLLFSLFLACPAYGVLLVGAEVPPFATNSAGGSGLAVEILQEAAKRLNESSAVSVMPFA